MKKLAAIFFGMLLGAAGVWGSYNYHVVRTDKEWLCVPKQRAALGEVYCDIREWGAGDWKDHPELVKNLVKHGRSDLVVDTSARDFFEDLSRPFSTSRDGDDRR